MTRIIFLSLIVVLSAFILSCTSPPPPKAPVEQLQPKKTQAPAQQQPPQQQPVPKKETKTAGFTLDKETYAKTKVDISKLIIKLNKIIESKDYDTWLSYLSKNYYDYYSNPEILKEQSESPLLKKYKITLRSLKDYFNYVVVGSRKNVRLDDIKALDADHIKAYMYIDNTPVIIYELVKINNQWKIAHFQD